jgi:RND family efflux transporter MFP subunit
MNIRTLTPLLVLLAGFAIAGILLATAAKVEPRPPSAVAPLVRVLTANPETLQLHVSAHGTVVPRTESELVPEVSGRVTWASPALVSGGFFAKAEPLLRIEPLDYEVALEQSRAQVARAESDLANARTGHKRMMDLSARRAASDAQRDDAINRLRVAEAAKRQADATLEKSLRDLERTTIVAPYDGRVRSERVDVGQFVNRGATVATIYAVDYVEVRLPIPDEQVAFLELPLLYDEDSDSSPVGVTLRARFGGREHEWQGEVMRTEGELDPRTRMVNVVARVPEPYARTLGRPPLSVGLFVEADIVGARVDGVVVLPRSALRTDNQVLIVDAEDRLRFRDVQVLRLSRDEVLIGAGLARGDRVCISPISTAIEGMRVRIHQAMAETGKGAEDAS